MGNRIPSNRRYDPRAGTLCRFLVGQGLGHTRGDTTTNPAALPHTDLASMPLTLVASDDGHTGLALRRHRGDHSLQGTVNVSVLLNCCLLMLLIMAQAPR